MSTQLPQDAIQRILFICPGVHVYNIPPLTSTKGHIAANWTVNNNARQIFTARLRIVETAVPDDNDGETVSTEILLEDPATGELFAAAPYVNEGVVEQVLDSSRFFAIRVQGESGRKALLGIGFEDRSEAFDFSVALQEVRKTMGVGGKLAGRKGGKEKEKEKVVEKKDFSLKEGQTITVNIGRRTKARKTDGNAENMEPGAFSLPPPPDPRGFGGALLPPPPTAQEIKKQNRLSQPTLAAPVPGSIEEMGFDDGEFGEFQ